MGATKAIILGAILGLSINTPNAGEISVLGGVDLDFNPNIALEYKKFVKNNIFLISGLRYTLESDKKDFTCDALSETYHCESSEYRSKSDIDLYLGLGYDFGKIDFSIYGGLGKSTQEYTYEKIDLKEGSVPVFRKNIELKAKSNKMFAGLKTSIETNTKSVDLFIDGSVSRYENSNSLDNKIIIGIKYNF